MGQSRALLRAGRPRFGRITLGIPYVEFDVPVGTAQGICAFYPQIMEMPAELNNGDGTVARVKMGKDQHLQFRETDRPQPDYDGHHVQIVHHEFLRSLPPAVGARPDLLARTTSINTLPRYRQSC